MLMNASRTTLTTDSPRGMCQRCSNPNERREHEAEKDRQRDRDEHLATEVERSDYDRCEDRNRNTAHRFQNSSQLMNKVPSCPIAPSSQLHRRHRHILKHRRQSICANRTLPSNRSGGSHTYPSLVPLDWGLISQRPTID